MPCTHSSSARLHSAMRLTCAARWAPRCAPTPVTAVPRHSPSPSPSTLLFLLATSPLSSPLDSPPRRPALHPTPQRGLHGALAIDAHHAMILCTLLSGLEGCQGHVVARPTLLVALLAVRACNLILTRGATRSQVALGGRDGDRLGDHPVSRGQPGRCAPLPVPPSAVCGPSSRALRRLLLAHALCVRRRRRTTKRWW